MLALGALNAFGGGIYGLAGAKNVPRDWLVGSPFADYTIPSLFLFVVVGASFLAAAVAVLVRRRSAHLLVTVAAVVTLAWLAAQVAIIGYVSWMQPTTAVAAVVILALASRLPRQRRAP